MVAAVLAPAAALPRQAAPAALTDALSAWDRGEYPAALHAFLELLDSPDAAAVLAPIALHTGELYTTVELTADGDLPRFSPDGRYFSYEAGRGRTRRTLVCSTAAPTDPAADLPGHSAAFLPDGLRVVYVKASAAPDPDRLAVRDLLTGEERDFGILPAGTSTLVAGAADAVLFAAPDAGGIAQIFRHSEAGAVPLTTGGAAKVLSAADREGTVALFTERSAGGSRFGVIRLPSGSVALADGQAPAVSSDGRAVVYVTRAGQQSRLMLADTAAPAAGRILRSGSEPLDNPAFSPDGRHIVYQVMPRHDWDIHVISREGQDDRRITDENQHDVMPRFLSPSHILGLTGEARHRRSYLYDLAAGTRVRLFHNNTIRTVAPEYRWASSPDGTALLIVADRDGDAASPQRGVYLMNLARTVTLEALRTRLRQNLLEEEGLRRATRRAFAPIADDVTRLVADASEARIRESVTRLAAFGSRHLSQPGNGLAARWLFEACRSSGYEPEYQEFTHRDGAGGRTANVIATLPGTLHPEVVYVITSHYDSVRESPGADDNGSGTASLLEAARILAQRPQPATIVFAALTGEESGLLGAREFVARARATKRHIAGVVNNDTIGWSGDGRLAATVRYASAGLRDVQHGAALHFTRLLTYDARYFRNTDAHAFQEAYGNIAGGFGSYPILASPHYHQPHDLPGTVNTALVTEVAKATVASVVLLASSPSPVRGLRVDSYREGTARLSWEPGPEKDVRGYVLTWESGGGPGGEHRVTAPGAALQVPRGTTVSVVAVNARGLESWGEARTTVE